HGDDAFEAFGPHLVARTDRGIDAAFGVLEFYDLVLQAFLRRLEQTLAHFQLPIARVELLTPGLQAFENRSLARGSDTAWLQGNRGPGNFELRRLWWLVADPERRLARFVIPTDRSRDVGARIEVEHLLRPGLFSARRVDFCLPIGDGDLRLLRHTFGRNDPQTSLVLLLHPLGERVAAVDNKNRDFEDKKTERDKQTDRDQSHMVQQAIHAALPRSRERVFSAKACAAAATAFAFCKAGDSLGREMPVIRTSRANN